MAEHGIDPGGRNTEFLLDMGLFQRREHFDVERARYASLAAASHTVIVAFTGSVAGLPPGVHAVALAAEDPRTLDWVLVAVRDAYVTALVATDSHTLIPSELTLEASRSFLARWTFRRQLALADARQQLDRLAPDLSSAVYAEALAHIDHSRGLPLLPRGSAQLTAQPRTSDRTTVETPGTPAAPGRPTPAPPPPKIRSQPWSRSTSHAVHPG